MHWDKAKNLTISCLTLLNVCLLILLFTNSRKFELTSERTKAITAALLTNNIKIESALPKSFKPLPQISVENISLSEDTEKVSSIISMFFEQGEKIDQVSEFNKTIYQSGAKILEISNDLVVFENSAGSGKFEFSKQAAKEISDELIAKYPDFFNGFIFDEPSGVETKEGYRLLYRQNFKNRLIYSNFIAFTLNENGIVKIEFSLKNPLAIEKEAREIIAGDEALFVVMNYLLNIYKDRDFTIKSIDIVYYVGEPASEEAGTLKLSPAYRVLIEGFDRAFIVDAYSSNIFN